jgi:hypothetical protein
VVSGNSLILAPANASYGGVVTTGIQTFAGNKTFSGTLSATSLTVSNSLTAGTVTYPNAHGTNGQILSTTGSGTLTWTSASAGISGVGTMTTTSYANGATVSGNSLILAPADANFGGVVSTYTQTFAGAKTFSSDLTVNGMTIGRGTGGSSSNVAIGYQAAYLSSPGNALAIGYQALYNASGINNLAIGTSALYANTSGAYNTGIGAYALYNNTTGYSNLAIGTDALKLNTTGDYNIAIGRSALYSNNATSTSQATNNLAIGYQALYYNTTGVGNAGIGANALYTNTTGTYNTAIGYNANVSANNLNNATAIGSNATVSASNTIQLGSTAVTDVKTSGKITAAGAEFSKAATNSVAYNASNGTTIDFSQSNLAYTGATPGNTFTLQNMKDGGTYTLAVQGSGTGTSSFSGNNPSGTAFSFISLGNYAATSGKHTLYTFVVIGPTTVYFSMVSGQ